MIKKIIIIGTVGVTAIKLMIIATKIRGTV